MKNKSFKDSILNFEIIKDEYSDFTDDTEGTIVYFKIKNLTEKSLKIAYDDFILVSNSEEKKHDTWLESYNISSTPILSNCFIKGAMIFKNLKIYNKGKTFLYINFRIDEIDRVYALVFEKSDDTWSLFGSENFSIKEMKEEKIRKEARDKIFDENEEEKIYDEEMESNSSKRIFIKELKNKLLNNVEIIETLNEEVGISIENINIQINFNHFSNSMIITGEIIKTSSEIKYEDMHINVVFLDGEGKILGRRREWVNDFIGYDTFEIEENDCEELLKKVEKLRIYIKGKKNAK